MKLVKERRQADRRHGMSGSTPGSRADRRLGDRRRRIARAGLLAALAMTARATHRDDPGALGAYGFPMSGVQTGEGFDLPGYFEVPGLVGGAEEEEDGTWDREEIDEIIDEAAAAHGVSPHLVRAVVETESQFNPRAVSPVGAKGLMQLMPGTAREVGITDPFDARQNVFGGTKYLSRMLERFNGNVALALAGYNAGPNNVARYRGIPPFRETRGYVSKIRNILHETHGALFPMPAPPRRIASSRSRKARARSASARQSRSRISAKRVALKAKPSSRTAALKARGSKSKSKQASVKSRTRTRTAKVARARTTTKAKAKAKAAPTRTAKKRR